MHANGGLDVTAKRTHAVVIGGSMAGLLAARVLADHFDRVTLLERDVLPEGAAQRRGVPQGQHTHGLLAGGRQVLDRLFPGFSRELVARGALTGDIVRDVRWFFEGAPLARPASGMEGLMATRPLLESGVRGRVRAIPNVVVRDGCQVAEPVACATRDRVTGVTLATGDVIDADLVVDATGRGSHAPEWLRTHGYDAAAEERVEIGLGYTTRFFRRDRRHLHGDFGTVVPPTPDGKRGGVMVAQEGDRWTVTLIAHFVPPAPADLAGFLAFARTLPSPDIHDVISRAEPLGGAVTSRFPASIRRRYERLTRFPEGYVVIGDGICSFNPIYGQGMSVAALEALALGDIVAAGTHAVGRRFFRRAAPIIDTPWTTAVGSDLRMPETVGPRSRVGALVNAYVARLHVAAHTDAALALTFMRVANLLAPPSDLLKPATAWRVLRALQRQGRNRGGSAARESGWSLRLQPTCGPRLLLGLRRLGRLRGLGRLGALAALRPVLAHALRNRLTRRRRHRAATPPTRGRGGVRTAGIGGHRTRPRTKELGEGLTDGTLFPLQLLQPRLRPEARQTPHLFTTQFAHTSSFTDDSPIASRRSNEAC